MNWSLQIWKYSLCLKKWYAVGSTMEIGKPTIILSQRFSCGMLGDRLNGIAHADQQVFRFDFNCM